MSPLPSLSRARDLDILGRDSPFRGFFAVERYRLRHRLFAGGWSEEITREVFMHGPTVAVLAYDPIRDSVVIIEQLRAGPVGHGREPWLLEIVAGLIEEGEAPEAVARREAREEAGITLGDLELIAGYYPSPGSSSEYLTLYCARVDAADAGGIHGHPDEGEDIRVVVLSFAAARNALRDGKIESSHAIIALQWLALNRRRLRKMWCPKPEDAETPRKTKNRQNPI